MICGKPFRLSKGRRNKYAIKYCSLKCRDLDPSKHAMLIQMNLSQQQGKTTIPERIGYAILDSFGITYFRQHLIANKFCVDAFVPAVNLVIQFDGDYWHGNASIFPNLDKRQMKRTKLDQSQDAYLNKCGFAIIRIWESDLKRHHGDVVSKLASIVGTQTDLAQSTTSSSA